MGPPQATGLPHRWLKMTLYSATTNLGKLREFREAARHFACPAYIEPLPGLAAIEPPEETGETFEANAILKAVYYSRHCGGWVFADDSGLVVDALGGDPGVRSARFAGPDANDERNNAMVLALMRGQPDRGARFVCVIALARAGALVDTFHGAVEGEILDELRGTDGFGYDPLFYYPPYAATLAQVDALRKLDVSHRGQALRALFASIQKVDGGDHASGVAPGV